MKGTIKVARSIMILGVAIVSQPIHAESASEAIKAFGLVGTWSMTCDRDPVKGCDLSGRVVPVCPARFTFDAPSPGEPKREGLFATPAGPPRRIVTPLTSAVRLTNDKIRLTWVQNGILPGALPAAAQNGEVWEIVYEKQGARLKVLELERQDGQKIVVKDGFQYRPAGGWKEFPTTWENTGQVAPLNEKCLD